MADWGGIVGLALSGASGLVENLWGQSMEDTAAAKEAALGDSPTFDVPQSQLAFESGMNKRVGQAMPGSTALSQGIESSTSDSINATSRVAGSQVGAQVGVQRALSNRRSQIRQMGVASQQYKDQASLQAAQAAKSGAQYDIAQYEYNEWLPWQVEKNEIAALRGTGQQQLMSGLDNTAAAGIYAANMYDQNQSY